MAPSQLSTTKTALCFECFSLRTWLNIVSGSTRRRSWSSSIQLALAVLPDIVSMTSCIHGKCWRSLAGATLLDAYILWVSSRLLRISSAKVVLPEPGGPWTRSTWPGFWRNLRMSLNITGSTLVSRWSRASSTGASCCERPWATAIPYHYHNLEYNKIIRQLLPSLVL